MDSFLSALIIAVNNTEKSITDCLILTKYVLATTAFFADDN